MHVQVRKALTRVAMCGLLTVVSTACLPATTLSGTPTEVAVAGKTVRATKPRVTTTTTTVPPTTSTTIPSVQTLLDDDFAGAATTWQQGRSYGPWTLRYHGYGKVGPAGDGTLGLAPQSATSPDLTSAAMVTSAASLSGDLDLTARMRTARQLRTGTAPNAWEVAWLVWHHQSDQRFYYLIAKPNGWELGKVDDAKIDPAGPECRWPEYVNCRFAGGQRFLATGSSPTFRVGDWHDLRVVQKASTITVFVNGQQLTQFTDSQNPYTSGAIGLYTEDADIRVDRVVARRP